MVRNYDFLPKRVSEETFYKVLNFLAKYVQAAGKTRITLSMDEIAEETKLNRATVVKAIKDLTKNGILTIRGGGGRVPYVYDYNGPPSQITSEFTLEAKLNYAKRMLRLYYNALNQFYDFANRIFEVEEKDDHFVVKVYKNVYGGLGINWGDANLLSDFQAQYMELEEELKQD